MLPLFQQAENHRARIAIREGETTYTYQDLLRASRQLAGTLLHDASDLKEMRIAFMINPGFDYVKTQWAIWQAGGVAVPLFLGAPIASIHYSLDDTGAQVMVVSPEYEELVTVLCHEKKIRLLVLSSVEQPHVDLPVVNTSRIAMILYTSGTTSLPKGVVTTHQNIEAQIVALVKAWEWSANDHTLCVLPLHHVHGIINVISCSLWAGACCEFIPAFTATEVFNTFAKGKVNVFMAVPTIYYKLIAHWESLQAAQQAAITKTLMSFRLMVCGSAALPVSVMEKWHKISGHWLLERYGMTEIGMGLSNPYRGDRRPGHVGLPLPGVQVRLCNEQNKVVTNEPGEIQVKGANVFKEYWQRKEATEKSFTADGWFKTGDVAEVDAQGYYKILGRNSQDIIKSGGYKISAIEIEEVLRQYPGVADASVIGLPDEEWGEQVAAVLVAANELSLNELEGWLREKLSKYKVPRKFRIVRELPRNAMGKVTKSALKDFFNT